MAKATLKGERVKKRTEKKLTLNRETVKRLEEPSLAGLAGGIFTDSCGVPVCIYPSNANISACKRCFT